jgi:MYXO-CTERM domain-containing protein
MGTFKNNSAWYVSTDVTTRGTDMFDVILYAGDATAPLPTGTYQLAVTAGAGAISVDGYVSDDKSSWAAGAAWDEGVATDVATIGVPSTADHCIAVGAMPDHLATEASWFQMFYSEYYVPAGFVESAGQVRAYSPRGPRIDGATKPDILGPDNPFAAYPHSDGIMYTGPHGSYSPFGGTSGASPHVTGVAALLAQVGIKGDAARDAIRKGAITDKSMGALPNGDYGYGRLNASGALGVTTPTGDVPTVTILASKAKASVNEKVTLTPQPVGAGTFQVKWDDGYDGTWDVPYATVAPRDITSDKPGTFAFKAHVRSSGGRVAEAVTYVTFGPATSSGSGSSGSGGCGCRATNEAGSAGGAILLGATALAFVRRRSGRDKRDRRG